MKEQITHIFLTSTSARSNSDKAFHAPVSQSFRLAFPLLSCKVRFKQGGSLTCTMMDEAE